MKKYLERDLYKDIDSVLNVQLIEYYKMKKIEFDIVRIESPSSPGVPDINVCIRGQELWIEAKIYPHDLGLYQIAWRKKRELSGGKVYVISYVSDLQVGLMNPGVWSYIYWESLIKSITTLLLLSIGKPPER